MKFPALLRLTVLAFFAIAASVAELPAQTAPIIAAASDLQFALEEVAA